MTNMMLGDSTLESLTSSVNAPLVDEFEFWMMFFCFFGLDLGWENLR
jgi:hypothetical protein